LGFWIFNLGGIYNLKGIDGSDKVAITATTGIAAVKINGITLHSFAGIVIGKELYEENLICLNYCLKLRSVYITSCIHYNDQKKLVLLLSNIIIIIVVY